MRKATHGVIFLEKQGLEIRDPKLPAVNAGKPGNAMELRRSDSPLPRDLPDADARQVFE